MLYEVITDDEQLVADHDRRGVGALALVERDEHAHGIGPCAVLGRRHREVCIDHEF